MNRTQKKQRSKCFIDSAERRLRILNGKYRRDAVNRIIFGDQGLFQLLLQFWFQFKGHQRLRNWKSKVLIIQYCAFKSN